MHACKTHTDWEWFQHYTAPSCDSLMCFPGDLPYKGLPPSSIVPRIVAGYRLQTPEHASTQVWVLIQIRAHSHCQCTTVSLRIGKITCTN